MGNNGRLPIYLHMMGENTVMRTSPFGFVDMVARDGLIPVALSHCFGDITDKKMTPDRVDYISPFKGRAEGNHDGNYCFSDARPNQDIMWLKCRLNSNEGEKEWPNFLENKVIDFAFAPN